MQQDCFVFHAHAKSCLSCGLHGWPETVPSSLARTRPDGTKAAKGSCTREEQKKDVSDVSVKAVKGSESYTAKL